jgi:DNA primase
VLTVPAVGVQNSKRRRAMHNSKSAKEQIRDRVDIVDIVSRYVKLDRHNKALCPFHEEKAPSFSVNSAGQFFRCFGCGARGDVFTFLQLKENKTFWEVLSELARETGVPLLHRDKEDVEKERTIDDILAETAHFYHKNLTDDARNYLTSRGITEETISRFQIGHAGGGLRQHLAGKGFSVDLCISAGVLKRSDTGEIRDFFYNRIVFPNPRRGRIVHMSGRSLNGGEPKYLHLPGEIRYLYNEDALTGRDVYITEGIPDCLSAIQLGYPAVAILGARSFKKEHAERFSRCKRVYVCLDPDKAGQEGSLAISRLIGDRARVISLPPDGGDLNDYLKSRSKEEFDTLVASAQDAIRYELSLIPEGTDKAELPKLLDPILKSIAGVNPAEAEAYLDVIKTRFGLFGNVVNAYRKTVNGYRREQNKKPDNAPVKEQDILPYKAVTPYPDPVDPARLLADISDTVRRFVVCDTETVTAVTLWIAMT